MFRDMWSRRTFPRDPSSCIIFYHIYSQFIKHHKTAKVKNKWKMQIQLHTPSSCFPVAHFTVIVAMLFLMGFFLTLYLSSTLSSTLLPMQSAWAWGLVPSMRRPGRCYVKPAWINYVPGSAHHCKSHHSCTSGKQNGKYKYDNNTYKKKNPQWKCL